VTKIETNTTISLTRQDKTCPECGGYMIYRYLNKRTIWTLQGPITIKEYRYACNNPHCPNYHKTVRPEKQLAPPRRKYGYDVMAWITQKRLQEKKTWEYIVTALRKRGLPMTRNRAIDIMKYYLTLASNIIEKETLKEFQDKEIAICIDGVNPENGPATLWIVLEASMGKPLHAELLPSYSKDSLVDLLRRVRTKLEEAGIKIRGIVSDKETYLVNAIRKVFPEVKHQLCQLHFIRNLADPVQKQDKILGSALKNSISSMAEYRKLYKKKSTTSYSAAFAESSA